MPSPPCLSAGPSLPKPDIFIVTSAYQSEAGGYVICVYFRGGDISANQLVEHDSADMQLE